MGLSEPEQRRQLHADLLNWIRARVALSDDEWDELDTMLERLEEAHYQFGCDVSMPI